MLERRHGEFAVVDAAGRVEKWEFRTREEAAHHTLARHLARRARERLGVQIRLALPARGLGVFAGIGLLRASAGVYGLVSYSAAQRTREFGIRMALGSPRGLILRSVVRSGAILARVGVATGIAASVASRTVLERFVWGISPLDPLTILFVAILLVIVVMLASLVPALRAVRLNPVSALRK